MATAGALTFALELVEETFAPHVSLWGSHALTILLVTCGAGVIAHLTRRNAERLEARLAVVEGHGARVEAALQAVVDAVPAPCFLVSRDHTLLTLNRVLAARLGRTIDEMRGKSIFAVLSDRSLARERAARMDEVFATGEAAVWQDTNHGRHYANHLVPVRGDDGEVWAIGVVAIDLTDLKKAEEQLGAKEELLRFGLEAARLGVWEWDIGTDTVIVSPEAISLLGGRSRAWRGSFAEFLQYVEPDDRARVEASLRSAAAGRQATEPDLFRARPLPKSPARWFEVQGRLFRGPEGRVRMVGTVGDAQAKVEADERRQRAELVLQTVTQGTASHTGQDFFSSLVEVLAASLGVRWVLVARTNERGVAEPVAAWADGRLALRPDARFGHAAPHVVSVPIVSVDGRPLGFVAAMDDHPPVDLDLARWVLALSAARAGAEIQRLDKEREIMRLNADLERRVAERTTELTSANRELEAFSYSVSHDLRAPLRSIDGFALALIEDHGDRLEPSARQYVEIVRQESQRMGHIIDDLLGLARIGRGTLARGPVNVSALCAEIVEDLRRREPQRRVAVDVMADMIVLADANLLRIALENLVGNAWKFTSRTPDARVEIGLGGTPALPSLYVKDNGAGFDAAHASKLFKPFARLHAASEYEGTGLGLATVARIVKRHGGAVAADSRPGEGATLSFTLPQPSPSNAPDGDDARATPTGAMDKIFPLL
jgi:PAS domain S-box-containing protein